MTIRNDNCRRQSGCFGLGALAERRAAAIALGVKLKHGGMVDEAVDRRYGHRWVGEDLVPRAEGLVAGRDQALALVTLGDELEQHGGLGLILADISEVIENQAIEAVELGERGWQ